MRVGSRHFLVFLLIAFLFCGSDRSSAPAGDSDSQIPELLLQTGHSFYIYGVAFSPDGKMVATGSLDNTLKLWDVDTGLIIRNIRHRTQVHDVAFSPDGDLLAAGVYRDDVVLYRVSTGKEVMTLSEQQLSVEVVAFSRDGKTLAAGGQSGRIALWDVGSGKLRRIIQTDAQDVRFLAFDPQGKILVTSNLRDHKIYLWDPVDGTLRIVQRDVEEAPGDLHVLAVGVSEYSRAEMNLRYASRDAEAFGGLWKTMSGSLYSHVDAQVLKDRDATATRITDALDELAKGAKENDTVILFLAGHGVLFKSLGDDAYYFAPHDFDLSKLETTAVSWKQFQDTLTRIKAKRVLLFLDACHSGRAIGGERANSERMAELLVKRGGVLVFASSRSVEFSYGIDEVRHGAFTHALLEGLRDGRADLDVGDGKDGKINAEELLTFLRARVPRLTNNMQTPTCPLLRDFGEPFPLAKAG